MIYTMKDQELKKLHVINCALEGKLTVSEAANALGLTERRVKQVEIRFHHCLIRVYPHCIDYGTNLHKLPCGQIGYVEKLKLDINSVFPAYLLKNTSGIFISRPYK